jgi:Flp pilus assembly protein TadD
MMQEVKFSTDGRQLACSGNPYGAVVWDARTLTEQVRIEREAASAWRAALNNYASKEDIAQFLRESLTLPDSARRLALDWLTNYREDPGRAANRAAWRIVAEAHRPFEQYSEALRLADAAAHLAPNDSQILNTLGVAQYRAGRFGDAVSTLEKSRVLNKDEPTDLAFLAMAQHQLKQLEPARATLKQLRERMVQPGYANNAEAKQFLAEAEALIDPPAASENRKP